ncbi:MAG: hypothetical protein AB7N24_04165 [Dehalococcoidia bacterium]
MTSPPVVYEFTPVPAKRNLRGYLGVALLVALIVVLIAFVASVFGRGWIVIGLIGLAGVFAYDEWLRFQRSRFHLAIDNDGGLHVETWSGRQLHWLPLMQEVQRTTRSFGADRLEPGPHANMGRYYVLRLRMKDGPTREVGLPGGARFSAGSGARMTDEEWQRFAEIVSRRWCPVRTG